ncbi:Crp/Fnr family transcriptional regulator [Desulfosporosinus sp. BICA1-9]|uniref:Crp/Fnr family transcriptional regulator n=1 Tax=Desulfosporosinus sp. BICA1-9 TaxID=1531958 RepID=UPI00054BE9AA|nr:Crp/Fnr family transcriptional regulator [Desulfosporosinus sp. BICA1-9]KJS48220.1 MAG: Crp/Fnr family transcriptional regulator [Peptococcaceae bacterium BRH_c23]KJS83279.1 MAG: Crp/Fnr family transcriptional regulator [Desulfosporosinus sp. BICA1-9]HBW38189.1 Crp/Fnr family transcriptional regulator [Desulfosporosinus sp.]
MFQITDGELRYLNEIASEIKYPKGQIIFSTSQRTNEVYYIKSGLVKIYRTTSDGRQVSVAIRYPGDFIGLAEVLSNINLREYSAEAMDNVSILIIWKDSFKKMLVEMPEFSEKLITLMSDRLREAQNTIYDFIMNPIQGRLAILLLSMAERAGSKGEDGIIHVRLRVTQEELACVIGSARQTISSLLSLLKEDGSIQYEGREIVGVNPNKLKTWIQE